jgi:hypothetical protein
MATILTDRLLSQRVGSTAADLFTTSRVTRRRSTELSETFKRF